MEWIGGAVSPRDPALWQRLVEPHSPADRRHGRILWDDARAAKELLSRAATAGVAVPLFDVDLHLTRAEFEGLARPWLDRTVALTTATLSTSGVTADRVAGVFLVGGASRVPLVATLLHRALDVAPVVLEQPELVVAQGSLLADASADPVPDTAPWPPPADLDASTAALPFASPVTTPSDPSAPFTVAQRPESVSPAPSPVSPAPTAPAASPVSVGPATVAPVSAAAAPHEPVSPPPPTPPAVAETEAPSAASPPAPTRHTAAVQAPRFAAGCLFLGVFLAVALGVSISSDNADAIDETLWTLIIAAVGLALLGLWPVAGALAVRVLLLAALVGCGVAVTLLIRAMSEDESSGAIITVLVLALLFLPAAMIAGWRAGLWSLSAAIALTLFPVGWFLDGLATGRLFGIPEALVLIVAAVSIARGPRSARGDSAPSRPA